MKARIITAIALLVLCVGMAVFDMLYVNQCAKELEAGLESCVAAAVARSPEWEDITNQTLRIWERDKSFYHILMPHTILNELEWTLGAIPEFLDQKDAALYIEQCVRGLQCLKTIREMEIPTWSTVF